MGYLEAEPYDILLGHWGHWPQIRGMVCQRIPLPRVVATKPLA